MENLFFGIGCFHFGINKVTPFDFKTQDYFMELENIFKSISNINNFKIDTDPFYNFEEEEAIVVNENNSINKGPGFFLILLILTYIFQFFYLIDIN